MTTSLTPQQVRELAAAAICDLRTVRAIYSGRPTKPATFERLRRAAEVLAFPCPPATEAMK
ncbi:MAG: hypothetical protein ABI548_07350 [Polyangiaceae bacterium]